jgi:hypothetical protein
MSTTPPFVVPNCADIDVMINTFATFTRAQESKIQLAWESNSYVSDMKRRLDELNIEHKRVALKGDLSALLMEKRVPLGGGPIVFKSPTPANDGGVDSSEPENKGSEQPVSRKEFSALQQTMSEILASLTRDGEAKEKRPRQSEDLTQDRPPLRNKKSKHGNSLSLHPRLESLFETAAFVDLRLLRKVSVIAESEYVELGGVSFKTEPRPSKVPIASFAEWSLLYARLQMGYLKYHPGMFNTMSSHSLMISEFAAGGDYPLDKVILYSRTIRQHNPGPSCNWSGSDLELVTKCLVPFAIGRRGPNRRVSNQRANKRTVTLVDAAPHRSNSDKFCNFWEKGRECGFDPCKFRHACLKCGSSKHKNSECPKSENA